MRSKRLITAILSSFMFFAACAPVQGNLPTPVDTAIIPDTGDTATPAMTGTTIAEIATEPLAATETPAAAGTSMTLMVNEQGAPPYLVDVQGRSLYAYLNDTQNSSTSSCIDDCAVEWPPLIVTSTPAAGTGVNPTLMGTIRRDDGSSQATYNGWPLYYYNMDTIPGTMNGQSYNGVWFLVSPNGEPIQQ